VENITVPQDDLLDIMELTQKLESRIAHVLKHNEQTIAMSALMSATINSVLGQCKTLAQVMFYRNVFMQIFDDSIRNIKIKEKD
jgi:hypothetical protein